MFPGRLHGVGSRPLPRPARAKPSPTRWASGSGSRAGTPPRAAKERRFDLKDFHRFALDLGGMGLDQLARELGQYGS